MRRLGDDSVDLGDGFLRLIRDASFPSDSPAAATVDLKFKHDDAFISDEFFKLHGGRAAPSELLNRILWHDARGWGKPYPEVKRSLFFPMAVDIADEDREERDRDR